MRNLEENILGLQQSVLHRDRELENVTEQLRVAQRELDEAKREWTRQTNVSSFFSDTVHSIGHSCTVMCLASPRNSCRCLSDTS